MAWTMPKTWTSEPLTSADLNTHLRDNLEALKDPPTAHYEPDELTDYTTTSATFVDVDEANLRFTLETSGGDVLLGFRGYVTTPNAAWRTIAFDVAMDGVRLGGDAGLAAAYVIHPNRTTLSFVHLVRELDAGSHTFSLQWRVNAGTGVIYVVAGTGDDDVRGQFWAREVS